MLLNGLPPESLTAAAMRNDARRERDEALARGEPDPWEGHAPKDPAEAPWSQESMLMATVIDELRIFRWAWLTKNSKHRPAKPPLVRRPGVGNEERQPSHRTSLTPEQRMRLDPRLREKDAV